MAGHNTLYSTMVRCGKATFFIDVKEAKNGSKYLSISETRIEGEEKKRTTLRIFGKEAAGQFVTAVTEAAASVTE